jgi:hypothetical protein
MRSVTLMAAAATALIAAGIGCGGRWLRWSAKPAAPSVAGKIVLEVADHREPKKGGEDPRQVGFNRESGGFGIPGVPRPILLPSATEYAESLRDLFGQAALTAGIGVAPAGDNSGTARVVVEVSNGWCDGFFPVYKANVNAMVTVTGPDNAPRMQPVPVASGDDAGDCQTAYKKTLTKLYDTAVGVMSTPQFKEAATVSK